MKHMSINPVTIVQEHMRDLRKQYRTTDDPQQKDVIGRRLRNLHNVLHLSARERHLFEELAKESRFDPHK
jgi:hypothetical protein